MNEIKVSGEGLNKILNIISTSIKKFHSLVTDMASIGKIENEKRWKWLMLMRSLIT